MAGGVRNVAHMGRITRQYKHDDISLGVTHRLMVRGNRYSPALPNGLLIALAAS